MHTTLASFNFFDNYQYQYMFIHICIYLPLPYNTMTISVNQFLIPSEKFYGVWENIIKFLAVNQLINVS